MKQRSSQSPGFEHSGSAEVSAEFLLRLVPIRPDEGVRRFIGWGMVEEADAADEVELEIEVAPCDEAAAVCAEGSECDEEALAGGIVSLHFHGRCYKI